MNRTPHLTTLNWIGIDVSKKQLDLSTEHPEWKLPHSLPNDSKGHAMLHKMIAGHPESKIIFEATGGYEKPLLLFLQKHGIRATRVNPAQVRAFARAQGLLAKTDKIDARLLARYGNTFQPDATNQVDAELDEIRDLLHYRNHLHDELHREKMQLEHQRSQTVASMIKRRIESLKRQIERISTELADHARKSPQINEQVMLLTKVRGVGELSAISLLATMPELGKLSRKQAAALAGVAPMNCDSGSMRAQRKIKGGRVEIRKAIYMAALVASRYEPVLRDFYQKLIQNGKAKKVALTAVMRKLIIYLNSLIRRYLENKPVTI